MEKYFFVNQSIQNDNIAGVCFGGEYSLKPGV